MKIARREAPSRMRSVSYRHHGADGETDIDRPSSAPLLALRDCMTMKLGMCGFTIGAAAYVKQFPVVEVQQTFYDPPPAATLEKWRSQAPAHFEFTMKAWQVITHRGTSRTYRRLRREFSDAQRADAGGFQLNDTTLAAWAETLEGAALLRATAI